MRADHLGASAARARAAAGARRRPPAPPTVADDPVAREPARRRSARWRSGARGRRDSIGVDRARPPRRGDQELRERRRRCARSRAGGRPARPTRPAFTPSSTKPSPSDRRTVAPTATPCGVPAAHRARRCTTPRRSRRRRCRAAPRRAARPTAAATASATTLRGHQRSGRDEAPHLSATIARSTTPSPEMLPPPSSSGTSSDAQPSSAPRAHQAAVEPVGIVGEGAHLGERRLLLEELRGWSPGRTAGRR